MSNTFISTQSIENMALGCFDGLHLGHKELLKHLSPENSALLIIDKVQNDRLTPREILREICEFPCIFMDFKTIKNYEAAKFLALLRKDFKNLKTLVVGQDFRFGKDRSAGALDIKRLSDFKVIIVKDYEFKGISVHSKTIKECLKNGDLRKANALLGREFSVFGTLLRGQGLGKKALVPTLNLDTKNHFLPKNGVWASVCRVWDFENVCDFKGSLGLKNGFDGDFANVCDFKNSTSLEFNSVSFIGLRSTDGKFSVETHILDDNFDEKILQNAFFNGKNFDENFGKNLQKNSRLCNEFNDDFCEFFDLKSGEFYQKNSQKNFAKNSHFLTKNSQKNTPKIELVFKEFLRENRHFDDLKLLKKQILKDCENALNALRKPL